MTQIGITGATGAMGRSVRAVAADRDDVTVALLVSRSPDELAAGIPVVTPDGLQSGIEDAQVDVLIDFSVPAASVSAVETATEAGVASVVGTTGFDDSQRDRLRGAAAAAPVLLAPNFSRGVQALIATLETALQRLAEYDIEVTETHHNRKRDAPSGTAERLLETIEEQRTELNRVHGREGETPRGPGEVGVHARRAGTVTGEHEVLFAGNDEVITLSHRAESRAVFASGALDAAVWIDGRSPGWYGFDSVVSA